MQVGFYTSLKKTTRSIGTDSARELHANSLDSRKRQKAPPFEMETNDGGQRGAFTGMDDGQMSKKKSAADEKQQQQQQRTD